MPNCSAIKINERYIRVFDFAHTVPLSTLGLASPGAIALIGDKSWTDITIKQQFESVTLQDIGPRLPSITKVSCLVLNDDSSMWTYLSSAQRATPKVLLIPEIHELVPSPESGYIERLHDIDLIKIVVYMDALGIQNDLVDFLSLFKARHLVLVIAYSEGDFERELEQKKLAGLVNSISAAAAALDVIMVERIETADAEDSEDEEDEEDGEDGEDSEDSENSEDEAWRLLDIEHGLAYPHVPNLRRAITYDINNVKLWLCRRRQGDGEVVTRERSSFHQPQAKGQLRRLLDFNQTTPRHMMT